MKRDFLTLADWSPEELTALLDDAVRLKAELRAGQPHRRLAGKSLGMIFEKASTRTRVSFETGMFQLGGHALHLSGRDMQLGRGETLEDTAHVLSRYLDGILIRTFGHTLLERLAAAATIPVINGLTDTYHPCQVITDLFTLRERFGNLSGMRVAFIGDGNNMAHSWLLGAALFGMDFRLATPPDYRPNPLVVARAQQLAAEHGATLSIGDDPVAAVDGVVAVHTDTWVSMGDEASEVERLAAFQPYRVDAALMAHAADGAVFMHCLPAHRGDEVTAELFDSPQSIVFDQAENRLHVQKAILVRLLGQPQA
ncbi:MAG: ornithine carbamoyltransferase [Nitrospirae bacterium CG18_big_fil_WC_8_21_14_2_50_70_55]|nr:ornithine carbamoyltransferase [Deltaproteobacteria bacterium]OIP62473.1 MAG: ornithine carbamoyltransferase [Nitrospirae bacterium CG2_30_70_394]PIQ07228.1 MAG: ornithine carbamoyltransferase [Nitrospirae bacterium CG18_big_fil_WC_8_21_14_2_50_70_55]PIU79125.1 MAG: ornithine carbamoyltransferase [Nitrospirae bacterium CG06_land_8_20_14_3_00_70_43]PIW82132.1 MAG: ornithine carbamoyltransferase [Nitrospirae bacterium CG_4_8_14_3_um_filter_70_85]PIX83402.1 MAG: ornithine carbamoyltransferase 